MGDEIDLVLRVLADKQCLERVNVLLSVIGLVEDGSSVVRRFSLTHSITR